MKFKRLTQGQSPIWVNLEHVVKVIQSGSTGSVLTLVTGHVEVVDQPPDQIID